MSTRKTKKPALHWLEDNNQTQVNWASSFLKREITRDPNLLGGIRWSTLRDAVQLLQKRANSVGVEPPDVAANIRRLDRRMRRAWKEKLRRENPDTKAYQFRMEKGITLELATLRKRWKLPVYKILENLISEAFETERAAAKAKKRERSRQRKVDSAAAQITEDRYELLKSQKHIELLESMIRQLYPRPSQEGGSAVEEHDPLPNQPSLDVTTQTVDELLERVREEVSLIQKSTALDPNDEMRLGVLALHLSN